MEVSRLNRNSLESQFLEYSVSGRLEVLEVMMFEIDPNNHPCMASHQH